MKSSRLTLPDVKRSAKDCFTKDAYPPGRVRPAVRPDCYPCLSSFIVTAAIFYPPSFDSCCVAILIFFLLLLSISFSSNSIILILLIYSRSDLFFVLYLLLLPKFIFTFNNSFLGQLIFYWCYDSNITLFSIAFNRNFYCIINRVRKYYKYNTLFQIL